MDCIQRLKFKSHVCEQLQIVPDLCTQSQYLVSGSEDGFVYLWDRRESWQSNNQQSSDGGVYLKNKQYSSATFVPFLEHQKKTKTVPNVTMFCPKNVVKRANMIKKSIR